jgi:hypothetical protein
MFLLDNSIPRDWFDWTNFTIGLLGLALTLWAVRQATGAKKAATGARDAVWKRTASATFQDLARLGSQLDLYTSAQRFGEASALFKILRPSFTEARKNFELELEKDSQPTLDEINNRLEELSGWLSNSDTIDANLQVAKAAAESINTALSGIAGQLQQKERKSV